MEFRYYTLESKTDIAILRAFKTELSNQCLFWGQKSVPAVV